MTATPTLERLIPLSELTAAGYGTRPTLTKRINDGSLPAVRVNGGYKIRERDLPLIAVPTHPVEKAASDLDALVRSIVDQFPRLSAEQKNELGRLLAPVA